VSTAIIYRPARAATMSAPRPDYWVLEFAPSRAPQVEPLIGHTASADPFRPVRLRFPDRESAVAFADRHDWHYILRDDGAARRPANPWRGDEGHRLFRGADAPGGSRIGSRAGRGRDDATG